MMHLLPDEFEIIGGWKREGNRVVSDEPLRRIHWLISDSMEKIAVGNWTILYRDKNDGRFWQLYYPHGELHGGGPESIRNISHAQAEQEYGTATITGCTTEDEENYEDHHNG